MRHPLAELPTPGGVPAVAVYGRYVAAGTETPGASWYDSGELYVLDLAERLQRVPPLLTALRLALRGAAWSADRHPLPRQRPRRRLRRDGPRADAAATTGGGGCAV